MASRINHFIISSFHHFIISSFHHFIISSFHHFIISSFWALRRMRAAAVLRVRYSLSAAHRRCAAPSGQLTLPTAA
jgi:hypothetical protein